MPLRRSTWLQAGCAPLPRQTWKQRSCITSKRLLNNMEGFGKAPIKNEGTAYNFVTGKEVESPGYVHDPIGTANRDLHYAISRIEEALSSEIIKSSERVLLSSAISDIQRVKDKLRARRLSK